MLRPGCVTKAVAYLALPPRQLSLSLQADTATPQVPLPPVKPTKKLPTFGFVDNAETINSRAAMIGFFALLALEAVAGKGILELVGIETGNGIDIGF